MGKRDDRVPEEIVGPDGTRLVRVRVFTIGSLMYYHGNCEDSYKNIGHYTPSFPIFLNGKYWRTQCGSCISDIIDELRKDDSVDIRDYRYCVLN